MACIEMYNPKNTEPSSSHMSPRISFSNDFADSSLSASHHHLPTRPAAYRDAPVSSDFEFSVTNYSMMSADELFFKGRLLPLKDGNQAAPPTTLREELQNHDDEETGFSSRPPKNPTRWRGFLGLRKSHLGSKKAEKTAEKNDDNNVQCSSKNSQDFVH